MRGIDRGKKSHEQAFVQDFINAFQQGSEWGIRDLNFHKDMYDMAFKKSDFSDCKYYIITFSNIPHLLYSGAVYPEYDFEGALLQKLGTSDQLDLISVNAISNPAGGCVVFQWMKDSDVNLKFIRSLHGLHNYSMASTITQFAFESFENLYMEPSWWESLGILQKGLSSRVVCGSSSRNHESKCFVHDGNHYYSWEDVQVATNVEI
jgi:hypothetical protein